LHVREFHQKFEKFPIGQQAKEPGNKGKRGELVKTKGMTEIRWP
jgi:hypothetical protein